MNINDWDEKEYKAKLEDAIWDDPEHALAMGDGHTDIHCGNGSYGSMVTRIIREGVKGAGSFASKEDGMDFIQNAAAFIISDLTDWVMKSRNEFRDGKDYHTMCKTVYMGQAEETGISLDNKFREIKSHAVRLVFERSYEPGVPFGFFLKTAYPDASEEHSEFTGRQFTKEEIMRGLYDFKSETEKLAFALKGAVKGVSAHYGVSPNNQEEYIRLTCNKGSINQIAYINAEGKFRAYVQNKDRRTPIPADKLSRQCPQIAEAICYADDLVKEGEIKGKIAGHSTMSMIRGSEPEQKALSFEDMIAAAKRMPDLPVKSAAIDRDLTR